MLIWMITRGWILFIPLVAILVLTVIYRDVRWAIVAITYLLVCVPMIITPIAFSHILTPKARRQLSLKSVDIKKGRGVEIKYFTPDLETGIPYETDSEIIPYSRIRAMFHIGSNTIVWLRSSAIEIIIIPDI